MAAAATNYEYVVSGTVEETHQATGEDGDVGLCSTPETATYSGRFTVHVRSTTPGLSDAQVLALLDAEPDGTVQHVSYQAAGSLVQRSGPHTYTMTYRDGYTVDVRDRALLVRYAFSARGTSEIGTRYSIASQGVLVSVDSAVHQSRAPLQVKGCLP